MTNDMTKGNPLKIFIFFTIPLLIGNIFQQLYSMVDTIIVGRYVGVNALAAVGATSSMFFLVNGMIQGLTSGFAVLVAQKFGAKDEIGLKKAVSSNIILTIVSTIIITILYLRMSMRQKLELLLFSFPVFLHLNNLRHAQSVYTICCNTQLPFYLN